MKPKKSLRKKRDRIRGRALHKFKAMEQGYIEKPCENCGRLIPSPMRFCSSSCKRQFEGEEEKTRCCRCGRIKLCEELKDVVGGDDWNFWCKDCLKEVTSCKS